MTTCILLSGAGCIGFTSGFARDAQPTSTERATESDVRSQREGSERLLPCYRGQRCFKSIQNRPLPVVQDLKSHDSIVHHFRRPREQNPKCLPKARVCTLGVLLNKFFLARTYLLPKGFLNLVLCKARDLADVVHCHLVPVGQFLDYVPHLCRSGLDGNSMTSRCGLNYIRTTPLRNGEPNEKWSRGRGRQPPVDILQLRPQHKLGGTAGDGWTDSH
mmetsp:Transcript_76695/g.159568  ORF Transcript_76695/g.159568 Transcript_76695/m.159568 type:complete len:217 (-) Transcript_76695:406-1056(-)